MSYKLTLLEMVQSTLSAMDSDDVNDISDTIEALQVVQIIKDTYYVLMFDSDWDHLKTPIQLDGLSDSDYPTTLSIADSVDEIHQIKYDIRDSTADALEYSTMTYKSPLDFTEMVMKRDSTASEVEQYTVKGSAVPILVFNDRAPTYWTSYDENYITLDAYDSGIDSTLQTSKNMAYCTVMPEFDDTDNTFVPVCPAKMFPTLLAETKKAAFFYLKGIQTPIDEKRAFKGTSILKQNGNRAHERKNRPRFGRR